MFNRAAIIFAGFAAQLGIWLPLCMVPDMPDVWRAFGGILSVLIIFTTARLLDRHIDKEDTDDSPRPVGFTESNHDWLKPDGMTDDECGSLPAYTDDNQSVSCWRVSFWDRLRILFTGRVWVGVLADGRQPPIWITIKKPFQKQERKIKDKDHGKGQKETLST